MVTDGAKEKPPTGSIIFRLQHGLERSPTPRDFEIYVKKQVESLGSDLEGLEVEHLETLSGYDGDYTIDVTARFRAFGGLRILCLFECKCQKRPVERRDFERLLARLHSVGAHKGVIVSLSGFQRGAIEYARVHGIAAIAIAGNQPTYAIVWWPFR